MSMYFVKQAGLSPPRKQPPVDPFGFDVVSEQPAHKPAKPLKPETEAGGWLDGTMN